LKNPISIIPVLAVLLCFSYLSSNAQTDTATADGLFQAARKAAFDEKNYPLAKHYSLKALDISPKYWDIKVFLGRLYSWDKQPDSAMACFAQVLAAQPDYEDAAVAYTDLEYWNDHYDNALKIADDGLKYHPASKDLLLRKAKVLSAMRRYKEAGNNVDQVLKEDRKNTDALAIASHIKDLRSLNRIGVSYDYVYFDKGFGSRDPWHLASIDYTRQTALGSIAGRINYANRFNESGVQVEMDAYPHISKMFYNYVNVGYSDKVGVFPQWRAGFSLYANLPKSFEAELGIRYLYFTSPTNIFIAYVGKYYKNYLFGVRTYLTPDNQTVSQSYNLLGRYYFGGADDYIGLTLGTGISPDDRLLNQQLDSKFKLKTYKAALDFRHAIKMNIVTLNFSIINQEYLPNTKGNQIQAGIGYIRRF